MPLPSPPAAATAATAGGPQSRSSRAREEGDGFEKSPLREEKGSENAPGQGGMITKNYAPEGLRGSENRPPSYQRDIAALATDPVAP